MTAPKQTAADHAHQCGENILCWVEHWWNHGQGILGPKVATWVAIGVAVLVILRPVFIRLASRRDGGG